MQLQNYARSLLSFIVNRYASFFPNEIYARSGHVHSDLGYKIRSRQIEGYSNIDKFSSLNFTRNNNISEPVKVDILPSNLHKVISKKIYAEKTPWYIR